MEFQAYQHLERLGTTNVNGIEEGLCYVFPKIDGTNASVWICDGVVKAGSRNRELEVGDKDNAGFYGWVLEQDNIKSFLTEYLQLRLYGEWLVPHSLKTYNESAWRNFYVFDVIDKEGKYLTYEQYKPLLDDFNIQYIVPICRIENPSEAKLLELLESNTFLIKDGEGSGEGLVIKNYSFINKFDRVVWAKIVKNEFKLLHGREMGVNTIKDISVVESKIVDKYVTKSLIEKEYAKIENETGWESKFIPRLLNTIFYSLIQEESWNFIKEFKNPIIDFKRLNVLTTIKIKKELPNIF